MYLSLVSNPNINGLGFVKHLGEFLTRNTCDLNSVPESIAYVFSLYPAIAPEYMAQCFSDLCTRPYN